MKRTSTNTIALLILLLLPILGFGQNVKVSGTIKDINGTPIVGVTVLVEGTVTGTSTNVQGKYSITAPAKGRLQFSSLGYQVASAPVNNRTTIDITMVEDTKQLDEVVVVGYGTMRRSDMTGSVASISSKSIEESVSTTIDQVLQGRIAGVQMVQNTGLPGGGSSIQIRGVSSLNSSNEPIYVVDGVIISGGGGSITSNPIADINPNDIESMEVLKDASATAIYGSQAANGVIIITLKKGKEGAPKISFNAYAGFQELPRYIEMMNLRQYAEHYNEWATATNRINYYKDAFSQPKYLGEGTNWQKAMFNTAPMQSYNLSVSGGNKITSYSASAGYLKQTGIAVGSDFSRMSLRLGQETNVRPWLRFGTTMTMSLVNQNTSIANWDILPNSLYQAPNIPVVNADGSYGGPDSELDADLSGYTNPFAVAKVTQRDNKNFGARGSIYLLFKPVSWFNFRTEFVGDGGVDNYLFFRPAYQFGSSTNAYATSQHDKTYKIYWSWKNIATFDYTYCKKHKMSLMLGHEMSSRYSDYLSGTRTNGANDLTGLDAGDANYSTNAGRASERRFFSVFGRMFYSYNNKYQFTATLRYDGSSNFAMGNRWGLFPSAAVAYRISEEKFFKPLKKVVDQLKFRVSYGEVGNSNVSEYAYESIMRNHKSNFGISYQTGNISNEHLSWETTRSWNAGMDLNMFKNRIEFIVDIYQKKTDNLLLQLELPGFLGTSGTNAMSAPWYNIGSMQNKGVEFTLNTVNITKNRFTWRSGLTFTLNRNKVIAMNTETAMINKSYQMGGKTITVTRTAEGYPVSQFYGLNAIGRINSAADFLTDNGDGTSTVKVATVSYKKGTILNNSDILASKTYIGDLLFSDMDNSGIIDDKDRTMIGNPLPKFTVGFNNTFAYKGFDMSLFLYASVGNKALNWLRRRIDDPRASGNLRSETLRYVRIGYSDGNAANKDIWNLYTLPGASASQVRMGQADPNDNSTVSSRFVEDASYLRIQNISLGYSLSKRACAKLRFEKVRFYVNLQNVYTFTKYLGYDPEIGSTQGQYSYSGQNMLMYGVDTGRVPTPRVYTFGVDLTF